MFGKAFNSKALGLAIVLMLMLVAMGPISTGVTAAQDLPPVELTYYFIGWSVTDLQLVEDKINEITKAKINATVKLNLIDWGSYAEKMKLIAASGEQCDLMFMSPEWNPYAVMVSNGALLPLDDLLPKYAPKTWASMPPEIWDAARVNGIIYGVINKGNQARAYGAWVRKDLMEKYGFDWTKAKTYKDLEPLYEQIAKNEPEVKIFSVQDSPHGRLWFPEAWGIDPIGGPSGIIGIRYEDKERKVINAAESPEYKQVVEMTHDWYNKGFFPKEPLTSGDALARRSAGFISTMIWYKIPGVDHQVAVGEYGGREIVQLVLSKPVMTTASTAGSITGVCATSPNPERAVMFIELLNTDPYLLCTLVRGVEGTHWVWEDQAKNLVTLPPGKTADEVNTAYRAPDWIFGNKYNLCYGHPSEIGAYEEMQQLIEEAVKSVALGLVVDYTPVRTEFAQVDAAHKQYCDPLERGMVDPTSGLPECQAKLKEAGIDKVIAEAQSQVDVWAKSKK